MNDEANPEKVLFGEALDLPESERAAYLKGACRSDSKLLARVERLLAVQESSEALLISRSAVSQPTVPACVTEEMPTVIGRYRLLQKIGEGGCGLVYLADQTEPVRRRVAVKVIKAGMDTRQVIARFEAERQALAMMDHPNIARVLDGGATETGRPYFVMELVRGIKITDYCDQNSLSTAERLELFTKVCQAVQHAHQKGIIHRDIKPSNILITVNDGVAVPKVIDFGIAKATAGQHLTDRTLVTGFDQFVGTPAYMSPEQAEMTSLDVDTRTDIYSLGVLLYELLTGTTPFDPRELLALGLDAMRRTIREKDPPRPSTRFATLQGNESGTTAKRRSLDPPKLMNLLRGDLDWIVMKCLEKDRSRRYETANGLAADLQRHLHNEPVVARPPTTAYRVQKALRRNKVAFTAAAVMATGLVVGITVSSWLAMDARKAWSAEKDQRLAAQAAHQSEKQAHLQADAEKEEANHLLYVANINLAQRAWEQNNVGRVRQLLEDMATRRERGFEWFYWQRQTHLQIETFRGHGAAICGVAFSPDGRRIVTGSYDKTAKVWDTTTGRLVHTLEGHSNRIVAVAFSPDGKRIVTGSDDSTARVWDATTGQQLFTLTGHAAQVRAVAYSPDGKGLVTGSVDQTAKVWDAITFHEQVTIKATDAIRSVAFSPDGKRVVTSSGTRSEWDVWNSGEETTAKVWEVASGALLLTLTGHGNSINAVTFSPDGRTILTGSWDNTAKVWDAASGKELHSLRSHSAPILSVAFSPDARWIVTGSADNTAKVWDVASGKELLALKGHSAAINSVAFSPDGERIVTASGDWMPGADHTARVWDVTKSRKALTLAGHGEAIRSVAFSPDGVRIVTGNTDKTAEVWDVASGSNLLTLTGHSNAVLSAAFSPDGQQIVTGSQDSTAKIWDASNGRELRTLYGHTHWIWSVAFSPDGQRLVTGSMDGTAKVWDATGGRPPLTLKGHGDQVFAAAFSPDGLRIVTCSADTTAKIWDAASGMELLPLKGHSSYAISVAFSPDGRRVVTGSSDRTAMVWDAASGKELLTLMGHGDQVWAVAFSPDSQRIVTGSYDQTAKVWETDSGHELLTLKGHTAPIRSVAFSPDGQRIVTGCFDGTAKVWEAAGREQVAAWQEDEHVAGQQPAAR